MKKIVIKKRHSIRKGQVQDLFERLAAQIGPSAALFQSVMIEILETNADLGIYLVNKKPLLMEKGGWVFPTLKGAVECPFPERRVTVDAGAIPYVVNGADAMRPGIVAVTSDVKKGQPVQIVDQRHGKPLAIGLALMDGAAILGSASGKMCRNFHHVGDELWNVEL
jgi:PUA domain protein